jgi:hypothetical protein
MQVFSVLGYLGLLPFIGLTLLSLFPYLLPSLDALALFQRYSAIILGFMAGVLWPIWQQHHALKPLAIFAVSLAILSFLAGFFPNAVTIAIELLLFIALRLGERWFGLDEAYPAAYLQLRRNLTRVVVLCHATLLVSLAGWLA